MSICAAVKAIVWLTISHIGGCAWVECQLHPSISRSCNSASWETLGVAQVLVPWHPCGWLELNSGLQTLMWPNLNCYRHLGSKSEDDRFLSHGLLLSCLFALSSDDQRWSKFTDASIWKIGTNYASTASLCTMCFSLAPSAYFSFIFHVWKY